MFFADLIADAAKLAQSVGILPEFLPVHEADGVDYEVGMNVPSIAVGGYLHFISRPCFLRKCSCNLMCLLGRDVFLGMEGLHILIEVDAVHFVVGSLRYQKLRDGIATITVDAADQLSPR